MLKFLNYSYIGSIYDMYIVEFRPDGYVYYLPVLKGKQKPRSYFPWETSRESIKYISTFNNSTLDVIFDKG